MVSPKTTICRIVLTPSFTIELTDMKVGTDAGSRVHQEGEAFAVTEIDQSTFEDSRVGSNRLRFRRIGALVKLKPAGRL